MEYILSILLPTYNTEKYLERCIDSLLDERINRQVEIIIVNDGSTDNSLTIARSYEQIYPFIVVVDKPNGGHGSTINKGIEIAKGKYFRVLDSDDWFETEQFVQYVEQLKLIESDMIVTWGYFDYVYKDKRSSYTIWECDSFIEYNKVYDFNTFDFQGKFVVMAQLTYLTSVLKQIPQKILENTFYVDNEFLLYPILNVNTITFLDYYIYHYFIGRPEQSINKKTLKRNIDHCERVAISILEFLKMVNIEGRKKDYMNSIALRIVKTYYTYLLSYFYFNRIWAYRLLKKWDLKVKESNDMLYNKLADDLYIKVYRKIPFISAFISPYIYIVYKCFNKK